MTGRADRDGRTTRRGYLGAVAATAAVSIAGCSGADGGTTDGGTTDGGATDGATPTAGGPATDSTPVVTRGSSGLLPSPVAGDPAAEVTLAVFEDFACPHCAHYNTEGFPSLREDYLEPGRIRYEHHDLPIPVANPGSWEAASAARAVQHLAGDETFYAFAQRLFENYTEIRSGGPALYESVATDLGLDGAAVRRAGVDRAFGNTVRADRSDGIESDVSSTPTFVVNGTIVTAGWGDPTLGRVETALDERLGATA